MAETANVLSVEVIKQFHDALATFIEEAKHALMSVDMDSRRTRDWVTNHQRLYWAEELKRRREKVAEARAQLHRKKLSKITGNQVHEADEQEAVRVAMARMREAEQKIEIVKRWATGFQHAVDEYHGIARPLGDMLEGDAKRALAMLDRMAASLEEYLKMAPPAS